MREGGLDPDGPLSVLLVEDDRALAPGLADALRTGGDQVQWVEDGLTAQAAILSGDYDLVVLDLQLPGRHGLRLLETVRSAGVATPVLILTARDGIGDRVRGLEKGGDDYVVKPCDLRELRARLRALHRRARGRTARALARGRLRIERELPRAAVAGVPVALTPAEHRILLALAEAPGRVISRRRLAEQLASGQEAGGAEDALKVHVHNLRRKLGQGCITTVRGIGYMLGEGT